jgi:hypothetical protein
LVNSIFNVVEASCKCHDILREKQTAEVVKALQNNEMPTGRGLNQKMNIKRLGDTRWSSHYGAIASLITMFSSIINTVENIVKDGLNSEQRVKADILIQSLQTFDFAFNFHLMKNVLGITNELSQALQRKDQDILNAMKLVEISKLCLQAMREGGWNSLFEEVSKFCAKNNRGNYSLPPRSIYPFSLFSPKFKMTLYPPKLSNCGNLTHLAYLFPKCPQHFFFLKKKIPKKKTKKIYKYMLGWPATTYGVVRPPQHIFIYFFCFFFFFFKYVLGAFWE